MLPPGFAKCATCSHPFPFCGNLPPKDCTRCRDEKKRARWRKSSKAYYERQQAEELALRRRREANRLSQRRSRLRRQPAALRPLRTFGAGGETTAWLGRPLERSPEVDVSRVRPLPPGHFNGRAQLRRQPAPRVRECEREECRRPLNLGRYKTKGTVCRKCRDADALKAKAAVEIPEEFAVESLEEIERQLNDTTPAEELDELLADDDEKSTNRPNSSN